MLKRASSLFLLAIWPQFASADIAVSFLDVGQGDATLVQTTGGCSILIDAGRHDRNDVLDHLSAAGVQHIDYLIGTHPHADHIGQFPDILSRLSVGEVWMTGWEHGSRTFERTLDAILDSDAGYEEPRAGHVAVCGNARMTVLHGSKMYLRAKLAPEDQKIQQLCKNPCCRGGSMLKNRVRVCDTCSALEIDNRLATSGQGARARVDGIEKKALTDGAGTEPGPDQADVARKVEYSQSGGLVAQLERLGVSIAVSSYQSGFLYMLGRNPQGGLHVHQAAMPKPMGLSWQGNGRLTLSGGAQILHFENVLAPHEKINNTFDACFVPRTIHTTGVLDAHDVGVDTEGRVIFVNTRFNCLATLSQQHSFLPIWQPSFIDRIVDEDRCHLNGLAMRDGQPAYVTAVSRSNTVDGWRDRRDGGGVVIDVQTNQIVCEGLSMPHSPRWHDGQLWVLNSGTGELGVVEGLDGKKPGRFKSLAFCPGFLRGLSFAGAHAVVGLSKPRYKRFEGLALDQRLRDADSEPWCGVQIIDLATGACVDWFRIDGNVAELYDVEVIPRFATPMAVSLGTPELANLITWEKSAQLGSRIEKTAQNKCVTPPADRRIAKATARHLKCKPNILNSSETT